MRLSVPYMEVLPLLLLNSGVNSFTRNKTITQLESISPLKNDPNGTTVAMAIIDNGEELAVIYDRVSLPKLFGVIPARVRKGMLDWTTAEQTTLLEHTKVLAEIKLLYGVDLTDAITIEKTSSGYSLVAIDGNAVYTDSVELQFYDNVYTDLPFNLLRGYNITRFKGEYTIIPMLPYPVDSFLDTRNPDYDPNGEIFGVWELVNCIITSGIEEELLRLPPGFVFESTIDFVKVPNVEVVCLNDNVGDFNVGNANKLNERWLITNTESPLYNESFKIIKRDEMTTGIKSYMVIKKIFGHISSIDNPEYRWVRIS